MRTALQRTTPPRGSETNPDQSDEIDRGRATVSPAEPAAAAGSCDRQEPEGDQPRRRRERPRRGTSHPRSRRHLIG
jgi:hypothetical protein